MTDPLLHNEPLIRVGFFLSVLVIMAVWEVVAARRPQRIHRLTRWPGNLLIVVLDTLAVRAVFPFAAVGAAFWAAEQGWGCVSIRRETDSNFGFNLPWWDRAFGSYRDQPEKCHLGMTIGIADFRTEHDLRLDRMLIQPFVRGRDSMTQGSQ